MWRRKDRRIGSNLNDLQLNLYFFMQKRLYINLMVNMYQKPLINMEKIEKKNPVMSLKKISKSERKTRNDQGKSLEIITNELIKWQ